MGRGGPIIWPPRSPDLNVLDFFVWGYIKDLVEHRRDGTEAEMREAILAGFNTIRRIWRIARRAILFEGPNSVYENEEGISNNFYIK